MAAYEDILHFNKITKTFPGVKALMDVDFSIRKGEVHALVGENGAGKSTLLNILKGVYHPDSGDIVFNGQNIRVKNPNSASKLGINMVHQELNLVKELTVGQNVLLGNEPMHRADMFIDHKKLYKKCDETLKELECTFTSKEPVKNLSVAQMQMVAIARTLMYNSSVIAFDEPTASLSKSETDQLFKTIRRLRENGTSIIYVSHRLEEIFEIADRVTVLRDGQYISTHDVKDIDKQTLVGLMVGRDVTEFMHHSKNFSTDEVVLKVESLTSDDVFEDVSFELHRGEILGIAGLVGAGRTEVVRAIFGVDPLTSGEVYINGEHVKIKSPQQAIEKGLALLPEERKSQGFVGELSNNYNINMSSLDKSMKCGLISHGAMLRNTERFIDELKVTPPNPQTHTVNLSGGNQQKVVLAKWMSVDAQILIFDEPTRGLDVGAKSEIYRLMDEFVKNGSSIIMVSSELPEIMGMSDRILVMHEGKVTADLNREEADEVRILRYAMGGV
ncbi:monosaccharide-transporting ATPase [Christensenellaceae bacterium]|nr:monosaccharide-transporting ATPase [Christensenellaceae bacterium]BDF62283.1 monosaccharide-transporting ATPase [Christensenellaceae bacterium]